jgi:flavin reductase (DIM6/NTAB) family NADH-FMN oxidoreductase RutF
MTPLELLGEAINPKAFWTAIGTRPLGATIVTAQTAEGPSGFLGLSFAHVSADPPTVLVSIGRTTSALGAIRRSEAFAVCVLPSGSEAIAKAFGGMASGAERFASCEWDRLVTGAPILTSAAAAFDCRLRTMVDEEQAVVAIGRVVGLRVSHGRGATVAYGGDYRDL